MLLHSPKDLCMYVTGIPPQRVFDDKVDYCSREPDDLCRYVYTFRTIYVYMLLHFPKDLCMYVTGIPPQRVCDDKVDYCSREPNDLCTNTAYTVWRLQNCAGFCKVCDGR